MAQHIAAVTFVVKDYDEAITFFVRKLDFELVEDKVIDDDKRWVVVGPRGGGTRLLLGKAATPKQLRCVGDQTGGRVFLFLETDDFRRDYERMLAQGVRFNESPREEVYGTVAVFEDLYGNKWDLLQRR